MSITNDGVVMTYKGVTLVSNFAIFVQLTRELTWYDRQKHNVINPKLILSTRK